MDSSVDIISSLDGRIRIKFSKIYKDIDYSDYVKKYLFNFSGIKKVISNEITGTVLVYYEPEFIAEKDIIELLEKLDYPVKNQNISVSKSCFKRKNMFLKSANPFNIILKNNEGKIARRFFGISFLIAVFGYILIGLPCFLSILIFSSPMILFYVKYASNYYFKLNFKNPNIVFSKDFEFEKLREIDSAAIDSDFLLSHIYLIKNSNYYRLSVSEIRRKVAINNLESPLNLKAKELINKLRDCGVIKIYLISEHNSSLLQYCSYIIYSSGILTLYEINKINSNCIFLIKNSRNIQYITPKKESIIVLINDSTNIYPNIDIYTKDIMFIPAMIENSRYAIETKVKLQNIALSINAIGMFLALMELMSPISAIAIYSINLFIFRLLIKNKIVYSQKELLNEKQLQQLWNK